MADNVNVKDASAATVAAATDQLSDSSQSPKVSLLRGDATTACISPATAYAEDAVANSGEFLTPAGAVRRDTAAASAANLDWNTLNVDANGCLWVNPQGDVAHDIADVGNPIKIGTKAAATLSTATLVVAADRQNAVGDLDGALIIRADATLADFVSGSASNTDGTSTQVIAAGAAGIKHYLTDLHVGNSSGAAVVVEIKDGATVKWTVNVPANGQIDHVFRSPIAGTAATAWNFDPASATTTVYCSAAAFKSKV